MTSFSHKISIAIGFAVACLQGVYGAERSTDLRHWNLEPMRATNVCRTINAPTCTESTTEEHKKTSQNISSKLRSITLIALADLQLSSIPESLELYNYCQNSNISSSYITENNQHTFNQVLLSCANAIRAP